MSILIKHQSVKIKRSWRHWAQCYKSLYLFLSHPSLIFEGMAKSLLPKLRCYTWVGYAMLEWLVWDKRSSLFVLLIEGLNQAY
jgi:hypothetical protein